MTHALLGWATALYLAAAPAVQLNVQIDSARFAVLHEYEDGWALAPKGMKLLILRYTVSNRANYPVEYSRESVSLAVTESSGLLTSSLSPAGLAENHFLDLRPGQSASDTIWIEVPAAMRDPRVRLRAGQSDTTTAIGKLIRPERGSYFAPDGYTVMDELPGKIGQPTAFGTWTLRVNAVENDVPSKSHLIVKATKHRLMSFSLEFANAIRTDQIFDASALNAILVGADGKTINWNRFLLNAEGTDTITSTIRRGKRANARIYFSLPPGFEAASLRMEDPSSGRTVIYRLAAS
ncbi:MAG: hypothetical protein SFX74_12455 [Fimbriimonadaceae bacterium]|nr:hypothetical protein [Fimbriimonadaceae bacterium]